MAQLKKTQFPVRQKNMVYFAIIAVALVVLAIVIAVGPKAQNTIPSRVGVTSNSKQPKSTPKGAKSKKSAASHGPKISISDKDSQDAKDNISLNTNEDLIITLTADQQDYQWQLASQLNSTVLTLEQINYLPAPQGTQTVQEQWELKAIAPGRTKISLIYTKPWDKNAQSARSETFTLNVQ